MREREREKEKYSTMRVRSWDGEKELTKEEKLSSDNVAGGSRGVP